MWLETPSNPWLEVTDIANVVRDAHALGALVAVDNTTATPMSTRPLDCGADFSMCSDSKMMTGHADLILGHVAVARSERLEALLAWRTLHGSIPGPMEIFLAHRSLGTLLIRTERCSSNAGAVASYLAGRIDVADVRYPGLPSMPTHDVASRQMQYFGPVVSFDLGSEERARRFLSSLELVEEATSFGGVASTAERRARWQPDEVPPGFIRMSVGCEDIDDIVSDVERALDAGS